MDEGARLCLRHGEGARPCSRERVIALSYGGG